MKMSEKSGRKQIRKICCILLAAAFLLSGPLQASADVPALYDPELILAIDVVRELDIRDAKGRPLQVSYNTGLQGRGLPGTNGREPDYQGVVGYAVVPNEPDFCDSPRFAAYFWMVPVYGETAEGTMGDQSGTVSHKTPVAVIGQNLEQADDGTWQGHLRTIRLDSEEICWMDVPLALDFAVVDNKDFIRVLNGGNALGDNEYRGILEFAVKALTYFSLGCGINCRGAVVKYKNFRVFNHSAGDTEPLLLSAGKVETAL